MSTDICVAIVPRETQLCGQGALTELAGVDELDRVTSRAQTISDMLRECALSGCGEARDPNGEG